MAYAFVEASCKRDCPGCMLFSRNAQLLYFVCSWCFFTLNLRDFRLKCRENFNTSVGEAQTCAWDRVILARLRQRRHTQCAVRNIDSAQYCFYEVLRSVVLKKCPFVWAKAAGHDRPFSSLAWCLSRRYFGCATLFPTSSQEYYLQHEWMKILTTTARQQDHYCCTVDHTVL